jgi:hypothetical protein
MFNWLRDKISDYSRSPQWSSVRKEHLKQQSRDQIRYQISSRFRY